MSEAESSTKPNLLVEDLDEEEDDGLEFYKPKSIVNSKNFSVNVVEQRQGKPEHKLLLLFHVLFKIAADVLYLFSGLMGMGYVATFIFVVILLSSDFWFTKNISGRFLAGLRWWNTFDEETGRPKWVYESWSAEERQVSRPFQGSCNLTKK